VVTHAPLSGLRVVHFGHLDPHYSRNRIVAKALTRAGAEVSTVTDARSYGRRTPALVRDAWRERADLILVGFPGHADVATAWLVAQPRRVPVLVDPFVSLQESVEDRGRVRRGSTRWRRLGLEDRIAVRLADRVLVDTCAHGEHFARDHGADPAKLRRLWVGADTDVMRPRAARPHARFRVFVYATFIPLHGLDHVVHAAALLEDNGEDVEIDVVGDGEGAAHVRALADRLRVRSVRFLGRQPYDTLPMLMAESDLCLGIFGTSPKARRVIPNKVFDALACARPVITADTPAMRELLRPEEEVWLCRPGDPAAIAESIVALREDDELRRMIASRGHARFESLASLDALAVQLAEIVAEIA
jgi:glycosyltransferase involved in cell wall biosynthesis